MTLIGLGGICVGAILQYLFSKFADERRHFRELRTDAYKDMIHGFSILIVASQTKNEEQQNEAIKIIADSKFRIAIYGSKRVLESMSHYWQHYEKHEVSDAKSALIEAVSRIRRETRPGRKDDVRREIEGLLFRDVSFKDR